ncbi:excalibur calcium-binding domain-containing protein [Paenibacillus kyungheensis]
MKRRNLFMLVGILSLIAFLLVISKYTEKPAVSTPINGFKSTEVQIQSEEKSNVEEIVTGNEETLSDSEPIVVETNSDSPEQVVDDHQLEKPQQSTVVESKEVLDANSAELANEKDNLQDEIYYENCSVVRDAGLAPLSKDDPGYSLDLDRDGDGVACE